MKFLVLGAGRVGYAVAYDLIRSPRVEKVIVADRDVKRVEMVQQRLTDEKVVPIELDVDNEEYVAELMNSADVTISCVTFNHNYDLAKIALQAKSHFVDLGGDEITLKKQFNLDEVAREQGVTIIPNLGLAPGMAAILAHCAAESFDELYEIRIRVGSLPIEPDGLFMNYALTGSIDGLLNEYLGDCAIIRDGKVYKVPALTDLESLEFPKPIGKLEAFNTSGGIGTLHQTYKDKVQHLDYKTIRYPGHCEQMKVIKALDLFSTEPLKLASGAEVVPCDIIKEKLTEKLSTEEPDMVLLRVTVTGVKERKPIQHVWECIDYGDEANCLSAMAKMTAFPASIIAQMIARGDITERGVLRQELAVPVKLFLAEMAGRGVSLTMVERSPVHESN
ncbi:saccharopine dehydrogenase NADP-binding domain-containing protein [Candidatus Obscuribacterales bacterium]|nr:saccharopine dehydrogenase NADP-binding domain-containing protein [Candidatus Obscuribacterales bacterium]MBX3137282.1 saccharopine dehydrogenase NADP-binding domain-containing protein [Candidatus Obscuribacterales bacterium]MBX3149208.1 saccharopine dehydrogenase NADP-binding domain-containing protein [Candidatus Obscuribacterales bacterium]